MPKRCQDAQFFTLYPIAELEYFKVAIISLQHIAPLTAYNSSYQLTSSFLSLALRQLFCYVQFALTCPKAALPPHKNYLILKWSRLVSISHVSAK